MLTDLLCEPVLAHTAAWSSPFHVHHAVSASPAPAGAAPVDVEHEGDQ